MTDLEKEATKFLNLLTPKTGEIEAVHIFKEIELNSLIRILVGMGVVKQEIFEQTVIVELKRFLEDRQNAGKTSND